MASVKFILFRLRTLGPDGDSRDYIWQLDVVTKIGWLKESTKALKVWIARRTNRRAQSKDCDSIIRDISKDDAEILSPELPFEEQTTPGLSSTHRSNLWTSATSFLASSLLVIILLSSLLEV